MTPTSALGRSLRAGSLLLGAGLLVVIVSAAGCGGSEQPGGGSGGAPTGSGGMDTDGASGGAESGSGGAASGGAGPSSGGVSSTGGASAGGSAAGGSAAGGSAAGGSGSGGGAGGDLCTRSALEGVLDAYFVALEAHDASSLPLSASVKFTENADVLELGGAGLWTTAGAVKHTQYAVDLDECTIAAHAVVPDAATDVPMAVRIKVDTSSIIEVETIVARPGDYVQETSDPAEIIAKADGIGWQVPVPEAQRNTREELIAWMEKYFSFFPLGVCDVTDSCMRLENGGGKYDCGSAATCSAGVPGPTDNNLPSRLILADVELGIGIGHTIYNGHTDMHMFKMIDGQVTAVHAILSQSSGQSGWD